MDEDPALEALRRLIGGSAARRVEIATKCGVNEQYLYQLARGLPLASGRPRRVGRDLREALDRHYPGWMAYAAPAPGAPPPALADALPVVLAGLAGLPPMRWQMARTLLETVVAHPEMLDDATAELQRLLGAAEPSRKRAAAG
jgi:hypothetical protein